MKNTKIFWSVVAFCSIQLFNLSAQKSSQQVKKTIYDVYEYGATGNGKTNDADGIQKTIDVCYQNGGGIVLLNNGSFLTSGIILKSNVELHITSNAQLLGYPDMSLYNKDEKFVYKKISHSLIYAEGCEHIAITGTGKIDGQGKLFAADENSERPQLIHMRGCRDIRIEGVFLTNSGVFAAWIMQCERLRIENVRIENIIRPNNDGFDIDGCQDVFISNCNIHSLDDCLAFKTSEKGFVCKNIVVTNCILSSHCAAIRFGPDAVEDIENVTVSNCVIQNTGLNGIKIQESMGAVMKDMTFCNIVMDNVKGPISIRLAGWKMNAEMVWAVFDDSKWEQGKLQNILFNNIRATVPKDNICISITGTTKTKPDQITFSNIDITFDGGGTANQGSRRNIKDAERDYPEMYMFGDLPAYGLYLHHASGIVLNNVLFHLNDNDLRPAIVCDDVNDLELTSFKAEGNKNAESLIRLENTQNVFFTACRPLNKIGTFIRIEGRLSRDIRLSGNKTNYVDKIIETTNDVTKEAISFDR